MKLNDFDFKKFGLDISLIDNRVNLKGIVFQEIPITGDVVSKRDVINMISNEWGQYFDNGRWFKFTRNDLNRFSDAKYFCMDSNSAFRISKEVHRVIRQILDINYKSEILDCDDFNYLAKALVNLIMYRSDIMDGSGFGILKVNYNRGMGGHALNFVPIKENNKFFVMLMEPQNGTLMKFEEFTSKLNQSDSLIHFMDM